MSRMTAEAIRWLEWGMRSYQNFALGLAVEMVLKPSKTEGTSDQKDPAGLIGS